ncbi:MAG: right-handed parallel beta-helix repeat-containing protein, partial [candidate division Zixibacteria bacterium]|nr:right-handed parallel beta-helix repeat-containing protein [candidate division Zixibacteria bacterium]
NAGPSVENCVFRSCSSRYGGAIYVGANGSTRILSCSFLENSSGDGGAVCGDFGHIKTQIRDCVLADNTGRSYGGGALTFFEGISEIENCRFIDNSSWEGGALWSDGTQVLAKNCFFHGNHASWRGGGIYFTGGTMTVSDCWFEENRVTLLEGAGGAILSAQMFSEMRVLNSTFVRNSAGTGGAIVGGLSAATGCAFLQNSANWAGAMYFTSGSSEACPMLDSCIFDGNSADSTGGALMSFVPTICRELTKFLSCTFVRNSAPEGSLLVMKGFPGDKMFPDFENCLIADNSGGPLVRDRDTTWLTATLHCCNIYGNTGGDWISYIASQADSNGNFLADPLFCDTTSGDFHLQGNSPCAPGNNSCGVLIGALPVACSWGCGDIDGSGSVNVTDAVRLVYYFFAYGPEPLDLYGGDINQDGHLNVADVVYLINYIFVGGPAPCAAGE